MDDLRFDLDLGALADFADSDEVEDLMQEVGEEVAEHARALALTDDGDGAASIHAETHRGAPSSAFSSKYTPEDEGLITYVSWDQDHFYMLFAEIGTEHQVATPFLRPALDQTQL